MYNNKNMKGMAKNKLKLKKIIYGVFLYKCIDKINIFSIKLILYIYLYV